MTGYHALADVHVGQMSVALAVEPCENGGEVHPGLKWQLITNSHWRRDVISFLVCLRICAKKIPKF